MPNIPQVKIGNITYHIKDEHARAGLDAISIIENRFETADWQQRYISPTTGNNSGVDANHICLTKYIEDGIKIKTNAGYKFSVFAYDKNDSTFVGVWDGSQFVKAWSQMYVTEFTVIGYTNYKFRVVLDHENDSAISISECQNLIVMYNYMSVLKQKVPLYDGLFKYTPYDNMELGTINGNPLPEEPWWVRSTSRTRTMRGHSIPLVIGDKITLTDYSDARFYIYWKSANNQWKGAGWLTKDYTVSENADYAILVSYINEKTLSNINDLVSLLVIYKQTSIYNDVYANIENNQRRDWIIKSINHRGFGRTAPENTLPAFKLSAKYGWKYVETDVRFTSDGVAVLLHDETINRTARNSDGTEISSTININDITYDQALTYDFGIWMGGQYAGTKIPTLEEFLFLCKKLSLNAYLELKSYVEADIERIVNIVNRCGMNDYVSYICFDSAALSIVLSKNPKARVGVLGDVDSNMITTMSNMKTEHNEVFIDSDIRSITTELIDQIAAAKIPLEVYTINGSDEYDSIDKYVTGVTSDYIVAGRDLYDLNIK